MAKAKKENDDNVIERPSRAYLNRMFSILKEALGDPFSVDVWKAAVKKARAHAGGVAAAAKRKMPAEMAELVEFERTFRQADDMADVASTGLMICFYLSDDLANAIALPEGESPDDLHVTLAYLGDYRQYGAMAKAEILTCVQDMARWSAPLVGKVSGTGRFQNDDGGLDVFYASVDIPGLTEFRTDLVRRLANRGTPIQTEHGFDPHITLAYISSDSSTPTYDLGNRSLRFDTIFVVFGDEEIEIPLTGISSPSTAGLYSDDILDICRDGSMVRLFVEQSLTFADPPEWFNFLPRPGVYTHPEYGEMKFTRERNQRFVDNFEQSVYQEKLPIDAEHDLQASGAVGWIVEMRINADGSVDARPEWNQRGRDLIEGDRYKYFSPAWFEKWTEPVSTTVFQDVAIGGAICRRPFFKEGSLRPLVASENGLRLGNSAIKADAGELDDNFFTLLTPKTATAPNPTEGDAMSQAIKFDPNNPPKTHAEALVLLQKQHEELTARETDLSTALTAAQALCDKANPPKTLSEALTQIGEKQTATESTARTATETASTATETIRTLTERVTTLEKTNRTQRFTVIAREFIGDRAEHVEMLELLYAQEPTAGEEGTRFKKYVENQKGHAARLKASGLFEEVGTNGDGPQTATEELEAKARKLSEDSQTTNSPITYEAALTRVSSENPTLYNQYVAEQRGA